MIKFKALACIALISIFSACTTTDEKYFTSTKYPPTSPDKVEVLLSYPTRPYIEIGEIKGKGAMMYTDGGDIKVAIRQTAADMGADAVIINSGSKVKYDYFGLNSEKKAIAIKWTSEKDAVKSSAPAPQPNSAGSLPQPQSIK